jgi:hypothetical protein
LLTLLVAVPAFAQAPKTSNAPREDLTIDPETITQSWKGSDERALILSVLRVDGSRRRKSRDVPSSPSSPEPSTS